MMVFAQNSSILHWAVHQPIAFHNFEISWGSLNRSLNNYGFISDAIFKNLYTYVDSVDNSGIWLLHEMVRL